MKKLKHVKLYEAFTTGGGKALLVFTGDWKGLSAEKNPSASFSPPSILNCLYIANPTEEECVSALEFDEEMFLMDVLGGDQNGPELAPSPYFNTTNPKAIGAQDRILGRKRLLTDLDPEAARAAIKEYMDNWLVILQDITDKDMKMGGDDQYEYYTISPRMTLNFKVK
jgi:hypothetical protein